MCQHPGSSCFQSRLRQGDRKQQHLAAEHRAHSAATHTAMWLSGSHKTDQNTWQEPAWALSSLIFYLRQGRDKGCLRHSHTYSTSADGVHVREPSAKARAYTGTEVLGGYKYASFKKSCFTPTSCSDKA